MLVFGLAPLDLARPRRLQPPLGELVVASFAIKNVSTPFGDVWIHLKESPRGDTKPYEIVVLPHEAPAVFDPHGRKAPSRSWREFIAHDLDEFGTIILEGYFQGLMKLSGENDRQAVGVLATVEDSDAIRLRGRIEEWCPDKYL